MMRRFFLVVLVVGLWGVAILPAQAQDTWQGNYYANPYFLDEVLLRQDANIAFDWGEGTPHPYMPADNFSVRWTKTVTLPAGNYSFIVVADDGVQIGINGVRYLDTFGMNMAGQTVGVTVALPAGTHTINVGYQELGKSAYITLNWGLAPAGAVPNFYAEGTEPQASSVSVPNTTTTQPSTAPVASSVGVPTNTTVTNNTLTPVSVQRGGVATVLAYRLNVRYQPYVGYNRFRIISQGERYNVFGTNADGSWVQIQLGDGAVGWVSARWVALD
jgi:hypothetical protein